MYKNFTEFLTQVSQTNSEKTALYIRRIFRIDRYTYKDLFELCQKLGTFFEEKHIKKGDRIMIWGPNMPEWVVALFGSFLNGVIVVPVNVHTSLETLQKFILETEPKLIFLSKFVCNDPERINVPYIFLEDLIESIDKLNLKNPIEQAGDDLIEIVYTSGTTGDPKGLMISNKNILFELDKLIEVAPNDPHYRLLSILPLSHVMEQVVGLFLPLALGGTIYYLPKINAVTISKGLNKYKITYLGVVPQMLRLLLDSIELAVKEKGKTKLFKSMQKISRYLPFFARKILFRQVHKRMGGHLKIFMCGSAPLTKKLAQTWENMGFKIIEGYGASETTAAATTNSVNERVFGTVGKPLDGVDVKILEDGEIGIKGPIVTPGYYKNETKTKEAFTDDGYFKTGDIGNFDSKGRLVLSGRTKFRIVTPSGDKVYPEDIERKLNSHASVWDSCVIGLPVEGGEVVHAAIKSKEDIDLESVIREVNLSLEAHQQIRRFSTWEEEDFPRLHTLKVNRNVVKTKISGAHVPLEQVVHEETKSDRLVDIISVVCKTDPAIITDDKNLVANFDLDSLKRVTLVSLIEEEYGVIVEEESVTPETSVGDLRELVAKGTKRVEVKLPVEWPIHPITMRIRDFLRYKSIIWMQNRFITDIEVVNKENINKIPIPSIIIFNHVGHYDHTLIPRFLPKNLRLKFTAVGDEELFKTPGKAFLEYALGPVYPINKYGGAVKESLELATDLLDQQFLLMISPEGEIYWDGELGPFKKGAGMLAVETGVPVIPFKIKGYNQIYKQRHKWPYLPPDGKGKVTLVVGAPLKFDRDTSYEKATEMMRDVLKEM